MSVLGQALAFLLLLSFALFMCNGVNVDGRVYGGGRGCFSQIQWGVPVDQAVPSRPDAGPKKPGS